MTYCLSDAQPWKQAYQVELQIWETQRKNVEKFLSFRKWTAWSEIRTEGEAELWRQHDLNFHQCMHNLFSKTNFQFQSAVTAELLNYPISNNNVKIWLNLRAKLFFMLNSLTRSRCLRSPQSTKTENVIGRSRSNHEGWRALNSMSNWCIWTPKDLLMKS